RERKLIFLSSKSRLKRRKRKSLLAVPVVLQIRIRIKNADVVLVKTLKAHREQQLQEPELPIKVSQVPEVKNRQDLLLQKRSQAKKKYKNKYVKPLKNFRVRAEKGKVPNIEEIKETSTVKDLRMIWHNRKLTARSLKLQSL